MKLVNAKNGLVLVEFTENGPIFGDPILEAEMRERGIRVPMPLIKEFDGKKRILAEDPDFQRAFTEIYYRFTISDKDLYKIVM